MLLKPAFLLLFAAQALAVEPGRTVALVFEPASAADAARVGELRRLTASALTSRGLKVVRFEGTYDAPSLAEGRAALEEARRASLADTQLRHAAATEALFTRALLGLKAGLGEASVLELNEVFRGLALTRLAQDDRALARGFVRTALFLDPKLTERDFMVSLPLRDLFREVSAGTSSLSVAPLRVESTPKGAEVYVNDELRGTTPLVIGDLRQGTHLVRIRKDGYYAHGWLVDLNGATTSRADLKPLPGRAHAEELTRALRDPRRNVDPTFVDAAVAELRGLYRCTDLIIVTVKKTKAGWDLSGLVAPRKDDGRPVAASLVGDATLLTKVAGLTVTWLP